MGDRLFLCKNKNEKCSHIIRLKYNFYCVNLEVGSRLLIEYEGANEIMYHARFNGTHYAFGKKWGELLRKNDKHLLENIPFDITSDMQDFARQCFPYYKKFFPEILEEINGIADGQEIATESLYAILFSMYALVRVTNCSSFVINNEKAFLLGRNSDFLTSIEKWYMNSIYSFKNVDSFSFCGNTTAFVEMEDGINQWGLAVALTSVFPDTIKPGLNVGMILRMILEKCRTVQEACKILESLPRCSAGTLIIADPSGDACLAEFTNDEIVYSSLKKPGYLCATNTYHLPELLSRKKIVADDWFAEKRYQTLDGYLTLHAHEMGLNEAKKLLAGEFGFLCQYDRETGKDTVWSTIYDLKSHCVYRCEGNPSRKKYHLDSRFHF